jgi:MFS family permease
MRMQQLTAEKSPYFFLLILCFTRFLLHLSLQNYPALIPVLQKQWQMSSAAAGSVVSSFHFGYFLSLVGLSFLTDWVSTKKVFIASCIAYAASSLLFAFLAQSYASAFILRGVMGMGLGGTYTPGLKLIAEAFSSSLRGRAMGFFIGASSLGSAGSLAASGWIAAGFGWRTAFFITALGPILGALIALGWVRKMEMLKPIRAERALRKEFVPNPSARLLIAGYSAHCWELDGMRAWIPAFLVACFLAVGSAKDPALKMGSSLSSLIFMVGVLSAGMAGYLSDRFGRTTVILIIMGSSIACSFSIGWMIGGSVFWIGMVALCYGFFVIAESPVFSSALSEVVEPHSLGTALGVRALAGSSVGAVAPTVFGVILDWTNFSPAGGNPGTILHWGWAFSALGLGALIGPWAMIKLRSLPESVKMAGGKE